MHVRDQRAFGWLQPAFECMARCAVFAAEFDLEEADEGAIAQALQLPDGKTLDELLPRSVWKNLVRKMHRMNPALPDTVLKTLHPMVASMTLSTQMLGEEANFSLDETLWRHAVETNKRTTGMETFEDQLNTLKSIRLEQHLDNLIYAVKNLKAQRKRLKKMLKYYAKGDVTALYRAAKRDTRGMRKVLLYKRNKNMAVRFDALARQQSLFCAVGAGHLAGGKGMLRLLQHKGYKLHPLPLQ